MQRFPGVQGAVARGPGESAYPHLWDGLRGLWVPGACGKGFTFQDFSKHRNHAKKEGTVSVLEGVDRFHARVCTPWGGGFLTDDTRLLAATGSAGPAITADITIMARIRLISTGWGGIFGKTNLDGTTVAYILQSQSDGTVRFFSNATGGLASTTACFGSSDDIVHVCFTRQGSSWRMYLDGRLDASGTNGTALTDSSDLVYFGCLYASQLFSGNVDDMRIYDRALSASEVMESYIGFSPLTPRRRPMVPVSIPNRRIELNPNDKHSDVTLSRDNTTATQNTTNFAWRSVRTTKPHSTGKWYFEFSWDAGAAALIAIGGIGSGSFALTEHVGQTGYGYGDGNKYFNNVSTALSSGPIGAVIGIAVDLDNGRIWFLKNGVAMEGDPAAGTGASYTGLASQDWYPALSLNRSSTATVMSIALRESELAYAPPAGFLPWSNTDGEGIHTKLNTADKQADIQVSNLNMTALNTTAGWDVIRAVRGRRTGKRYVEFKVDSAQNSTSVYVGLLRTNAALNHASMGASTGYLISGTATFLNGTSTAHGLTTSTSCVYGIAIDFDAGKMWFNCDGVWEGGGDPSAGTNETYASVPAEYWFPAIGLWDEGADSQVTARFDARSQWYRPNGFEAWDESDAGVVEEPIVWNHADRATTWAVSKDRREADNSIATHATWDSIRSAGQLPSDRKVYWEMLLNYDNPTAEYHGGIGIANRSMSLGNHIGATTNGHCVLFRASSTNYFTNNAGGSNMAAIRSGVRLMCAWDPTAGKWWVGTVEGGWLNSGDPAAGTGHLVSGLTASGWHIAASSYDIRSTAVLYSLASEQIGTPPDGFEPLVNDEPSGGSTVFPPPFLFQRAA